MAAGSHSPAERARVFAELSRRNRVVEALRMLLPGIGLAVVFFLVAQIVVANFVTPHGFSDISIESGQVVIGAPRYEGVLDNGTRYRVAAEGANVPVTDADQFYLQGAVLETVEPDGYVMTAAADQATLNTKSGIVDAEKRMFVSDSTGLVGHFDSTIINWPSQTIVALGEARLKFPDGSVIEALGATFSGASGRWVFQNSRYVSFAPPTDLDVASGFIATIERPDDVTMITADRMIYSRRDGLARFEGQSVLQQSDARIEAPRFVVTYTETNDGGVRPHLFSATEGFTLKTEDQTISGERLDFDPDSKDFSAEGGVRLATDQSEVTAPQLQSNFETRLSIFTGTPDQPVAIDTGNEVIVGQRVTFDPELGELMVEDSVEVRGTSGTIFAPRLVSNTETGLSQFGDETGRVRGRFETDDPVSIVANAIEVRSDEQLAIFSGNVTVQQPGQTIQAERVLVHLGDGNQIRSYEALGNVRVVTADQTSRGDRGVYDPAARLMRLSGNVRVTSATGDISADGLVVDLARNISTFTAAETGALTELGTPNETGRVTGVFAPN